MTAAQRAGLPETVERFFARGSLDVAADLLGSRVSCGGVVVELTEVEAYAGEADPASHAFRGATPRTKVMFGPPGRVYVYLSYGMHRCINLVCEPAGTASAVLLRAGRVVGNLAEAQRRRGDVQPAALARGPGNLAKTLGITLEMTGTTLWDGPVRWSPAGQRRAHESGPRVGVSTAADNSWRLWLPGEASVSTYRRHPKAPKPVVRPDI